jgi:hypothetical protein
LRAVQKEAAALGLKLLERKASQLLNLPQA